MTSLTDQGRSLWSKVRSSREGGRSVWSAIGLIGSSITAALTVFVAARSLGTAGYGVYAGIGALVGLAATFGALGVNQILLQRVTRDRGELANAWGVLLAANVIVGIPLLGLTIGAASLLLPGRDLVSIALIALAEYITAGLLMGPAAAWVALDRFPIVAGVNILKGVLRLGAACALLVWTADIRTLAIALLVSMVAGALLVNGLLWRTAGRPRFARSELADSCRKGAPHSVANVSTNIQGNIDQFMLLQARLDVDAGLYAAGVRFMAYSMLPLHAMTSAMVPEFYSRGRHGVGRGLEYAKKSRPTFAVLSLIGAGISILLSSPLGRLFGDRFTDVVPVVIALSLFPLVRSAQTIVRTALLGSGHQGFVARTNMVTAALNVGLNVFLIPRFGWQGAVAATYASEIGNLVILFVGARRFDRTGASPGPGLAAAAA